MVNKIESKTISSRKPGRPFNTTKYPWRSTAIGRSFILWGWKAKPNGCKMYQKLKKEGFEYSFKKIPTGFRATRID